MKGGAVMYETEEEFNNATELELIRYFKNYSSTHVYFNASNENRIASFDVPLHYQWVGWVLKPGKED